MSVVCCLLRVVCCIACCLLHRPLSVARCVVLRAAGCTLPAATCRHMPVCLSAPVSAACQRAHPFLLQAYQDMLIAHKLGPSIAGIENMVARARDLVQRWADWKDHYQVSGRFIIVRMRCNAYKPCNLQRI